MAIEIGRRRFIGAVGGATIAWPLSARAQQSTLPIIGFLLAASPNGFAAFLASFLEGLKEAGYVDGKNVTVEYSWTEGQNDRLPSLADDLVRRQVAVIIASGGVILLRSRPRRQPTRYRLSLSVGARRSRQGWSRA